MVSHVWRFSWQRTSHFRRRVSELVSTLVDEVKDPGSYGTVFNAGGLASGVYPYQLKAGSIRDSRKLMIVR